MHGNIELIHEYYEKHGTYKGIVEHLDTIQSNETYSPQGVVDDQQET